MYIGSTSIPISLQVIYWWQSNIHSYLRLNISISKVFPDLKNMSELGLTFDVLDIMN